MPAPFCPIPARTAHDLPTDAEICKRWHLATVRNCLMTWQAVSTWLAAEALMASVDGFQDIFSELTTLSNVALRRALDLQPERETEAA